MAYEPIIPTPDELNTDAFRTICIWEEFKEKCMSMVRNGGWLEERITVTIPGGMGDEALTTVITELKEKGWEAEKTTEGFNILSQRNVLALRRLPTSPGQRTS